MRADPFLLPIALLLVAIACAAPPRETLPAATPLAPKHAQVCAQLAHVFFLVAENRSRGMPKEDQVRAARDAVDTRFVTDTDETLDHLLHVVDLVYLAPEQSAAVTE